MKSYRAMLTVVALAAMLFFMLPLYGGGSVVQAASPPRIVLTFDDGYNLDHRILDFLASQGIPASAFVVGSWAQRNPALLEEMNALGWDICNHTQNHPWLTKLTDQQIVAELNTCQAVIGSVTNQYLPIFRPPGGFIDARVMAIASSIGYAPVMWDFDSGDSSQTAIPVQDRVNHMVGSARDGSIILFHFGGRGTYEMVTGVVKGLQERGFCFVTLSELYGWKNLVRGGDSGPGIADASLRHYFAEGTTRPGFEEWIMALNPGVKTAQVRANFYSPQEALTKEYSIPAGERLSILVNTEVPWQDDVSVVLESSIPLAAERMLYFNHGAGNSGGSLSRSVSEASEVHYFPEGTARPGFQEYLAVFNPSGIVASQVEVELIGGEEGKRTSVFEVQPLSRTTVCVNELVEGGDCSMIVRSTSPVVAERSEYFTYKDILAGSHCASGAYEADVRWFFAEGTTRGFGDGYLSLLNPCEFATWVRVRMIISDGSLVEEQVNLGPGDRKTLNLSECLPGDIDYSLSISSLLPIAAERTVYFQSNNVMGGYSSAGTAEPRDHWLFPEGCTAPGFSEWLALFNPERGEQVVRVEYIRGDGERIDREYLLPPEGRITVDVAAEAGPADEISIEVDAPTGIVAERSLYFCFSAN
jgi:peptidoglycan/xylan/chitin deacetylase (PgdA/CDA1 family)